MISRKKKLGNICREFNIVLLYLFGSQKERALLLLNGEDVTINDPLTDVDIGVVFKHPLPRGRKRTLLYSKIYNRLDEIFFPFKLDLVFLEENHSVFQAEAVKGHCLFTSSVEIRDAYEEEILRRACDFKPFLEKYYEELLEESKT